MPRYAGAALNARPAACSVVVEGHAIRVEALERQRGITVKSAVVSFVIDDGTVNLIDTPGHLDSLTVTSSPMRQAPAYARCR